MNAYLRKDVAVHSWVLVPACLLTLVLLLVLLVQRLWLGGPLLSAFRTFVVFGLVPMAWLLVDRFVTHEYVHGGLDLLERLPVGRLRVLLGKAIGIASILAVLMITGLMLVNAGSAAVRRPLEQTQLVAAAVAGGTCLGPITAFLFAAATLGRHRLLVHLAGVGALLIMWRTDALTGAAPTLLRFDRFSQLGPPQPQLWVPPVVAIVTLCSVAALLWSVRRGGLARAWAGRLRGWDALRAMGLAFALTLAAGDGQRQVYQLDGPVARPARTGARVAVRVPEPALGERAQAVADDVDQTLRTLEERTGVVTPAVAIDFSSVLVGTTFERGELATQDGLLLRVNYADPEWDPERFRAFLLHEALDMATDGRLRSGPWRLLLDGYPVWLASRGGNEAYALRESGRASWGVAALEGAGAESVWSGLLRDWGGVRRATGDTIARSVAGWALGRLETRPARYASGGDETVDLLMREACSQRLGLGGGLRSDLSGALEETTGLSLEAFAAKLEAAQGLLEDPPAARPTRLAQTTLESRDGRLVFSAGPGPGGFALLHGEPELRARLAGARVPARFARNESRLGAGPATTARRYRSGARVLAAFAVFSPELDCDLVFGWREVVLP